MGSGDVLGSAVSILPSRPTKVFKVLRAKNFEALEITAEIARPGMGTVTCFLSGAVFDRIRPRPLGPSLLAPAMFRASDPSQGLPLRGTWGQLRARLAVVSIGRGGVRFIQFPWPVLREPSLCVCDERYLGVVRCPLRVHVVSQGPVELPEEDESLVVYLSADLLKDFGGQSRESSHQGSPFIGFAGILRARPDMARVIRRHA